MSVLTREIMGLFALGVLWLNAGLVVAVALRQLGNLRALGRRFRDAARRGELVSGTVESPGRFAVRRITQMGRAITSKGPDRILFTDGPQSFEVIGGRVATGEGVVEVAPAPPVQSEVWVGKARSDETLSCSGAAEFERAWKPANTFKGFARDAEIEVVQGDRVWVLGRLRDGRVEATESEPLLVSMLDPVALCDARARLIIAFVIGAGLALAGVTALALWPPVFGWVSTLGGALGLVYFLAVQPLGTAVRDAVKTPARRMVGALWARPAQAASRAAA